MNPGNHRESPKRSLSRRIFIYATWVALAYSVYAVVSAVGWQTWLATYKHSPFANPLSSTVKLDESELVGLWVPEEGTAARLKALTGKASGDSAPRISLNKGSFEAKDLPYMLGESAPQISFASWRGNWNLYQQQDAWAVYLPGGPVDARGFVQRERGRYQLGLVVGDPAVNKPLWFVKK